MLEEKIFVENFIIALVVIPFIVLYVYGMCKIFASCFGLISKFIDALEWRIEDWIYRFKKGDKM